MNLAWNVVLSQHISTFYIGSGSVSISFKWEFKKFTNWMGYDLEDSHLNDTKAELNFHKMMPNWTISVKKNYREYPNGVQISLVLRLEQSFSSYWLLFLPNLDMINLLSETKSITFQLLLTHVMHNKIIDRLSVQSFFSPYGVIWIVC